MTTPAISTRTVARRTAVVAFGNVGTQLVTVVSYVVLARLAEPELFGAFAAASILVAFGTLFVESGMSAALVQRRDRLEEAAATALMATLLGGLVLAGASAALSPVVGAFFEGKDIGAVALAVSGVHVLNAVTVVPDALLQRRMSLARGTVVESLWIGSYGAVAAIGLAEDLEIWAFVVAIYVAGVVRAALVWALVRWRPTLSLASFAMWRELASYGRHVLAGEFVRHSGGILNTATIGRVLGVGDLAQFNYGNRLATQSATPLAAGVGAIVFPALAAVSSDQDVFARGFTRALRVLTFVALPLSLAFLAVGEPLAVLLFGEAWRPAGRVLASMCLVPASLALVSLALETFKAGGRPQALPRIHLPAALVPIAALAIGAPIGLVAIGAVMSVGLSIVAGRAIVMAGGSVQVSPRFVGRTVLGPAVSAALSAVTVLALDRLVLDVGHYDTPIVAWLELGAELIVFAVLYLATMRTLAPRMTVETVSQLRHLRPSGGRRTNVPIADPSGSAYDPGRFASPSDGHDDPGDGDGNGVAS